MRNFTIKQDFVDTLNADEANSFLRELANSVVNTLIVPDVSNSFQLRESIRRSCSAAPFFTCTGPANTYSLSSLPGYPLPTAYFTGMEAMFVPSTTNSGASTVAIGTLAATSIKTADGSSNILAGSLVAGRPVTVVFDGTFFRLVHVAFSGSLGTASVSSGPLTPGGRLSLSPNESVPLADLTGNTVYYVPHVHDYITLWDGTSWTGMQFSSPSVSYAGGPGSFPADVFAYKSGTSVLLETVGWSSDSARATTLVTVDGRLVKNGDPTRLYLGTVATALLASTISWTGSRKTIYNMYNKVSASVTGAIPTVNWYYSTASWRATNSNTSFGQGRIELLRGLPSDYVDTYLRSQLRHVIGGSGQFPTTGLIGVRYNDTVGTPDVVRTVNFASPIGDFANSWQGYAGSWASWAAGYGGNGYRTRVSLRHAPTLPGRAWYQQMEFCGTTQTTDGFGALPGVGQLGTTEHNEITSRMEM